MRVASKVWMPCPGWNMGGRTWKHGNIYPSPCQLKQKTTNHHTHFNLLSYNRQAKKERRDQKLLPSTGTRLCTHSRGSYMGKGSRPLFLLCPSRFEMQKLWWQAPCNRCPGCLCRMTDHQCLQFLLFRWCDSMTFRLNLWACLGIKVVIFLSF